MTHELNITESKCVKNTSYLRLFQDYYDNMKQQCEQIVFVYFLIQKTRDNFTCIQGVGTGALFFMCVSCMSETLLDSR